MHAQRIAGFARSDIRVAVAIAADPRAEGEHRRRIHMRFAVGVGHGFFQIAIDLRHAGEQRRTEVIQPVTNFILDRGPRSPQLLGLPQNLDILADMLFDLLALQGIGVAEGQFVEPLEDAAQGIQHRPRLGLGGMRGEHRDERQRLQPAHQIIE